VSWIRSITAWLGTVMLTVALASATPWQNRRNEPPFRAQNQGQNQGHVGQWLRQHRNLTPEQQRRALESEPRFRSLPPQQQQRLRNQLDRFSRMPSEQQDRMLNRMETWEHLTPEQKQQARDLHFQMQQLPPERQQAMRNAVQALRGMPPEARQREINSDRYKSMFSPHERDMLNNASKLPLGPAEPNRQESPEPGPEE